MGRISGEAFTLAVEGAEPRHLGERPSARGLAPIGPTGPIPLNDSGRGLSGGADMQCSFLDTARNTVAFY